MGLLTFKGGIHPPDKKELAKDSLIRPAKIPQRVVIPLSQHVGAPCKSVVVINQEVKKGEVIGEPGGEVLDPLVAEGEAGPGQVRQPRSDDREGSQRKHRHKEQGMDQGRLASSGSLRTSAE